MQGSSQGMSSDGSQGMSMGGGQDMSMDKGGSSGMGMGSSGSSVVQKNVVINQNIVVIATNAGGSSQTQQMNSQIQPPAATHTVGHTLLSLDFFVSQLIRWKIRSQWVVTQALSTLQTVSKPLCTTWCNSTSWPRTTRSRSRLSQCRATRWWAVLILASCPTTAPELRQ